MTAHSTIGLPGDELAEMSAEHLLQWTRDSFGEDVILTSSFGVESAVTLHMATRIIPGIRVVLIDTGYLFPETYRFVNELVQQLDIDLRIYTPALSPAHLEAVHGRIWEGSAQELEAYQKLTKEEPMQRALAELEPRAWIAGVRGGQTAFRSRLPRVATLGTIAKVHPILNWDSDDVAEYLQRFGLPRHPLHVKGYRSIGDVHSTFPTLPGQDPRDGRRLGSDRECGLHTMQLQEWSTPVERRSR